LTNENKRAIYIKTLKRRKRLPTILEETGHYSLLANLKPNITLKSPAADRNQTSPMPNRTASLELHMNKPSHS
jgi:hypothetical protein